MKNFKIDNRKSNAMLLVGIGFVYLIYFLFTLNRNNSFYFIKFMFSPIAILYLGAALLFRNRVSYDSQKLILKQVRYFS
jgi:hypothetical protein